MFAYRVAKPAPAAWNVLKTLVIMGVFGVIFAWGIPTLLLKLQRESGDFDALFIPQQVLAGKIIFVVSSLVVLWAGLTLAISGGGTPLSIDAPRRLVIRGPYAWLRTPMVTGTIGQGIGFGLATGSIVVMIFFVVFALLWNSFIRPTEEDQLQHLFGRSFELYRRSVRCWLPMRGPWSPPAEHVPVALDQTADPNRRRRRKSRH